MADTTNRTTAEWIGAFHRELLDQEVDLETARSLTQMAGSELIREEGLHVKEVGRDG